MVVLKMPKYITDIINVLEKSGYDAYIVGGAVRDLVMSKSPSDYDIVTNARPWEIIRIFRDLGWRVIPKGAEYGVVSVLHPTGVEVEIASMRKEVYPRNYQRRIVDIEFTDSIEEDLARRDFTINAMAYNLSTGLVDPFGGLKDIRNRTIRFVGEPRNRIREDPLRMLRAVRFATKLGFGIHPETFEAIREEANKLKYISRERIGEEIIKAIKSDKPYMLPGLLYETNLYKTVLPELGPMKQVRHDHRYSHYGEDVLQHTIDVMRRLSSVSSNYKLRLASMLHDIGKPYTMREEKGIISFPDHEIIGSRIANKRVLETWRRPAKEANYVERIVKEHMKPLIISQSLSGKALARRLIARYGPIAQDLALHAYADTGERYWLDIHDKIRELQIEKPKPIVTGHDILALGVQPGPLIGELKRLAYELQLQGIAKEQIMEEIKKKIRSMKQPQPS